MTELLSEEYLNLNKMLHIERKTYGASGHRWAAKVGMFTQSTDILDYGCGKGTLKKALGFEIAEYDPCIPGKEAAPEPHDFVVCTDVLEHIEPEYLNDVLADIARVTKQEALLVVATRAAKKVLPDGRNAHLIIKPRAWWMHQLCEHFVIMAFEEDVTQEGEFMVIAQPIGSTIEEISK